MFKTLALQKIFPTPLTSKLLLGIDFSIVLPQWKIYYYSTALQNTPLSVKRPAVRHILSLIFLKPLVVWWKYCSIGVSVNHKQREGTLYLLCAIIYLLNTSHYIKLVYLSLTSHKS